MEYKDNSQQKKHSNNKDNKGENSSEARNRPQHSNNDLILQGFRELFQAEELPASFLQSALNLLEARNKSEALAKLKELTSE